MRVTFSDFKQRVQPSYQQLAFHRAIDYHLEMVADYIESRGRTGIGRLIINIPPRHGKTLTTSQLFPAWLLGRMPWARIIMAGYGTKLPKKSSRYVRNMIRTRAYQSIFPNVAVADDSASATEWEIANMSGGVLAAGVGAGITGYGGNLLLVDDPIRSRSDAESATKRDRLKDWWNDDFFTRLEEPGGAVIVMCTRWHFDDLAGWLLAGEDAHEWTHLRLPALAEENDPLGRTPGEALWEEKMGRDKLLKMQAANPYGFASLYQQTPIPRGAGLFDAAHIQVVEHAPECVRVVRFYDLAITAKARADYSVGLKLGLTHDERFVILDVWREQRELPDVHRAIVQNAQVDGTRVPIRIEGEKGGLIQLQFLLRDPALRGFSMDAKPPIGDKYTRAAPVASRVNAGRFMMVRGRWNRALLDELALFPNGQHDDQVDALSGAFDMLVNGQVAKPQRLEIDW